VWRWTRPGRGLRDGAGRAEEGVRAMLKAVCCGEGGRGGLEFPTRLDWPGGMSGLLCIILLYSTGRERRNCELFS